MTELLQLDGVTVNFEGLRALDRLSLCVDAGVITGLIGPNGAGKTTAFNVMTGFVVPDEGRVTLRGETVTGASPVQITRRGVVRTFQELRLFPTLTVIEHVVMALPRRNVENPFRMLWPGTYPESERRRDQARARALLDYVGLNRIGNERLAGQLSYGQQKLLSLARAMATESDLLLLDEPTSGLDAAALVHKLELMRRLVVDGKTICVVEHNIEVVANVCDRVIVLDHGTKVAEGKPHEVMRDPVVLRVYLGG